MNNSIQTSTNILQTTQNRPQTGTNILPTTRKSQMMWLAGLTAITLIGQYVLLGTIGLGRTAAQLPESFFVFEKVLWGFRGLVEIAVVVYVGMTKPQKSQEGYILWLFEGILITMIVLTVGPVWGSLALNARLVDILGWWGVVIWGLGLSGISAIMLAAVAYAYKVQPVDEGYFVLPFSDYERMLVAAAAAEVGRTEALAMADTETARARREVGEALAERDRALAELQGMREAVGVLRFLPPSAQVQIVALFANGRPDAATLADAFRLSESTVRGVLARVNNEEG